MQSTPILETLGRPPCGGEQPLQGKTCYSRGRQGTTGDCGELRGDYGGLQGTAGDYRELQGTAGGPGSFYSLVDCGGRPGQPSLAVGRWATFEKDRTGPPNAVPGRPAPERTDCPVANTGLPVKSKHSPQANRETLYWKVMQMV